MNAQTQTEELARFASDVIKHFAATFGVRPQDVIQGRKRDCWVSAARAAAVWIILRSHFKPAKRTAAKCVGFKDAKSAYQNLHSA